MFYKPAGALPTYGELIDLFEEFGSDHHLLCAEISKQFPSISIKHPGCVADTITRIVAPTKRSLNGTLKVNWISITHLSSAYLEGTSQNC